MQFFHSQTEYRQLKEQQQRQSLTEQKKKQNENESAQQKRAERPRRLSFKERRELEALTEEIAALEDEKQQLEKIFSGIVPGDINDASRRYEEVKNMIDEKELRWLELSEIE